MIDKIKALEELSKKLDPSLSQRNDWNAEVIKYANQFIEGLGTAKAYYGEGSSPKASTWDIDDEPADFQSLLEVTRANIDKVGINPASGGHMGYIPGGGLYPSALGDFIAAINNRYAGVFFAAPGAVRLENTLIRWMSQLMGFPESSFGNLTSGGSIANLIAIVTARESFKIRSRDVDNCVIYLSEQAHHSIQKAIGIAGLSDAQLRYIPLDKGLRLSVDALESAIIEDQKRGLKPFFINASFGTTNTGAIDPIAPISSIAREHHLWLHVDAAYGGFFKLLPEMNQKFHGIEHADSITLDPHKTLFLPFGTGAILIKSREKMLQAHHYLADYMQDTVDADEEVSPADVSPELTKHFRGMRLWLPLKLFGLKPFKAALQEKLLLTRYFYDKINETSGFETGPEPELSVAMFRYVDTDDDLNTFNKKLIQAIQKDGRIFLSSTTIDGIFWIRVAVVIFRTHLEHIDLLLQMVKEKVAELRQL